MVMGTEAISRTTRHRRCLEFMELYGLTVTAAGSVTRQFLIEDFDLWPSLLGFISTFLPLC